MDTAITKRILLVDDDDLIAYSLSKIFSHDGKIVTSVRTGRDALQALKGTSYDICMLDVHLPDANGLELMPVVRKTAPATVVVIMTAESLTEEQLDAVRRHGCHYLPKPFELAEVLELIAGVSRPGGDGGG